MATFTIRVSTNINRSNKPSVINEENTLCFTTFTVRVPVPSGQTRYISVNYLNGGTSYVDTINSTTEITVTIEGSKSSQSSLNTVFSTGTLRVALTNTSPTYYSKQINREHTGNIC